MELFESGNYTVRLLGQSGRAVGIVKGFERSNRRPVPGAHFIRQDREQLGGTSMDVVYLFRHSQANDWEIRYSLRSINAYLPYVNKIWVFGDRPSFLSNDTSRIEHVPHEYLAHILGCRTPVTNTFMMLILASLLPDLTAEYMWFCDDYILLDYLPIEVARKTRYIEDLGRLKLDGGAPWQRMLGRTCEVLQRLGYPCLNFEAHLPTMLTKKRVIEAFATFRDFVSQDRVFGILAATAIFNHACKKERLELTLLSEEGHWVGFHGKQPSFEEALSQCRGKTFLNFDDAAFGEGMRRYLTQRFPHPSIYENHTDDNGIGAEPEGQNSRFG